MLQADDLQCAQQESYCKLFLTGVRISACKTINLVTGNAQLSLLSAFLAQLVESLTTSLNSQMLAVRFLLIVIA